MYMIEITEDKIEKLAEHAEHGLKHLGKLMQCLEEMKEEHHGFRRGMRDEEDEMGYRGGMRGSGRYSRY